MTDRDEFAKAALMGLLGVRGGMTTVSVIVEDAYRLADAMVTERDKSQPAKDPLLCPQCSIALCFCPYPHHRKGQAQAQPEGGDADGPVCSEADGRQVAQPASPDRLDSIASMVREAWTPQAEAGRADTPLPNDEIEAPPDHLVDVSTFKRKERADKPDEWDEMAEGLLPCTCYYPPSLAEVHTSVCPAAFRPAVAAKLRELHEWGSRWRSAHEKADWQGAECLARAEKAERERDEAKAEHKRICDEAVNDSERKLERIKAYKAKLAEAERDRDAHKAMLDEILALDDIEQPGPEENVASVVRDALEYRWEQCANALTKYRQAVELMRPVAVDYLNQQRHNTSTIAVCRHHLEAIARFVEEHDRVAEADKEGDNG